MVVPSCDLTFFTVDDLPSLSQPRLDEGSFRYFYAIQLTPVPGRVPGGPDHHGVQFAGVAS
jgi:hypothetical protein